MNRSVLIADDEENVREALKRLLRREKCDVHTADGGPSALDQLSRFEPAVFICDERMPGMAGSEVLAQAARLRPDTYRISLTAYAELRAIQNLINEGHIHRFMLKPWDDDQVRIAVEEGFRTYKLIQDNRELQALTIRQKAALEEWNGRLEDRVHEQTATLREQNRSLAELRQNIEQSLGDTVSVLAGILEAVSLNLGIHSKRVAELAVAIGSRLNLTKEELRDVEFVGYLHDIGRVSAGAVLTSKGKGARANHEDRTGAKYALAGYAILSRVRGFDEIARSVRHQAERYDGKGHPEGLAGEDIPLAARITRVADTYDNAVFRPEDPTVLSREAGHKALLEHRGKSLDPQLVDLLLESLDHTLDLIDTESEVELSVGQLKEGMALAQAVTTAEGVLLLAKDTILTEDLIARMSDFAGIDPVMTRIRIKCTLGDAESTEARPPGNDQNQEQPDRDTPPAPRPAGGQQQPLPCPDPPPRPRGQPTRRPTREILVVDDSMSVRNALSRELSLAGFSVRVASNGVSALQLLQTNRFHAAIVDLAMPTMGGSEFLRRLAKQQPKLPCIVVTGCATRRDIVELSSLPNVRGFLVKPWDTSRLIAMLQSVCEQCGSIPCQESVRSGSA